MSGPAASQDASTTTTTTTTTSAPSAATTVVRNVLPFAIGAFSGCIGTTCIQPADVVKVRIQLTPTGTPAQSPFAVARSIVAQGKITDLWAGLSAGYVRQISYGSMRLGFFDRFSALVDANAAAKGRKVNFFERAGASIAAGALAAGIANPAEVALVRMQSDGMKPRAERANYRGVFDALIRIGRADGVKGLWTGTSPTVTRAMATNFGQLAFFSQSKAMLKEHTSMSFQNQTFAAAMIAGFFASFFSLPFDFLKTRMQRGGVGPDGKPVYRGMLDCAIKALKEDGPLRFYRGFGTYFVRIAPHTVITLFVSDNLKAILM